MAFRPEPSKRPLSQTDDMVLWRIDVQLRELRHRLLRLPPGDTRDGVAADIDELIEQRHAIRPGSDVETTYEHDLRLCAEMEKNL